MSCEPKVKFVGSLCSKGFPYPGIHLWRDPHGRVYLVDHTGTRKLRNTEPAAEHDNLTIEFHDDDNGVQIIDQPDHAA